MKETANRYKALWNLFTKPDSHSVGVIKLIDKYYPAFAKKVFHGNPLMERFVMSGFNSMDILQYPICGHCETLAAFNGYAKVNGHFVNACTCFKCGKDTIDPILFHDWCMMELKKRAPEHISDELELAVDTLAERVMEQARSLVNVSVAQEKPCILGTDEKPIVSSRSTRVSTDPVITNKITTTEFIPVD